jgi:precorrin-6B methylase 2
VSHVRAATGEAVSLLDCKDIVVSGQARGAVYACSLQPSNGTLDASRVVFHRLLAARARESNDGRIVFLVRLAAGGWMAADILLIAGLAASVAHAPSGAQICVVLSSGEEEADLAVCARVASGALPVPRGSVIDAGEWSLTMPRTQERTPGTYCLLPAGGTYGAVPETLIERVAATIRRVSDLGATGSVTSRLFRGESGSASEVESEIGETAFADLLAGGVLIRDRAVVRAGLILHRTGEYPLLSDPDLPELLQGPTYLDPLWEGPVLARLLLRWPIDAALDLGCGCGLIALALAGFAKQVLAVDINPRALAVTRLNAELAGRRTIEVAMSDLFSNLGGRRFDAIVFNAPLDIEGDEPLSMLMSGRDLLDRFLEQAPAALSTRGWMLANIAWSADEARVDGLLAAFGRDEWRHRDVAILVSAERCSRTQGRWRRGVLLCAPGSGRTLLRDFDCSRVRRRIDTGGRVDLDSWLGALESAS